MSNENSEPNENLESTDSTNDNQKSTKDKASDLIREKLDAGFELKDRNSKLELNKLVRDSLKLSKGHHSDINKFIKDIAVEKKLALSDLGFKNEIDGVTVNLVKTEPEIQTTSTQTNQIHSAMPTNPSGTGSPRGALPKTETERQEQEQLEPENKVMSEQSQAKLIKRGLNDLIAPLYIAMGIIEPDEEEKQDESKVPTAKKFRKDMDSLGDEINSYLIENHIQLPALLNHLSIVLSILMVLVVPVLKFKFFSSKQSVKPEYDETAQDVKVEL